MRFLRYLLFSLVLAAMAMPSLSQQTRRQHPGPDTEPFEEKWERQRQKARNEERHKDLKQETDKLLQLATELKERVDKSNENTLSLEVIRKAEEIEKLAKKVREKMKAESLMPGPGGKAGF